MLFYIKYKLSRFIRLSLIGKSKLYFQIRFLAHKRQINNTISRFCGTNISQERRLHLRKMMRNAYIKYRWEFDEFFLFKFETIDEKKKRSFVPEYDKNLFAELINNKKYADIFLDKWNTYKHFSKYFGRDVYNVRGISSIKTQEFENFINKHHSFIMKPVFGTRGSGIQIISVKDFNEAELKLQNILNGGTTAIILEEVVQQDERLAAFHEKSCNTIRIVTLRFDDRVEILQSFLRLGQGNSVVDNAGAGGIMANIDIETGKIYAACDERGKTYTEHPESKLPILGYTLPKWEEAKEVAKNLALVLPEVRYVGWDLALSEKGWVMIEGNDKGQFVFQYPAQEGFRDKMNSILRELGKKEIK